MQKSIVLALALLLGSFSSALAGQQDFTLTNDSGSPICDVFISPDNARDWQEDLLENDRYCIAQGESIKITFDRHFKGVKLWDLRIVDKHGKETIYEDFDLTKLTHIKVRRNGTAEYW